MKTQHSGRRRPARVSHAIQRPPGPRTHAAVPATPPVDPVRAAVAELSAPLLEWWDVFWPFGKEVDPFAVLSGRIPAGVAEAFPLESPRDSFALLESVVREKHAIREGHNEKFESVVTELAPLGIPRDELISCTACPFLPAYQWAIDRSNEIERRRPELKKLAHRLRVVRKYLTGSPFSAFPSTPPVIADINARLDYLAGTPTEGALRTWRRKRGINSRSPDLWKLKVWTPIACALVDRLRSAQAEARIEGRQFAERSAHALLRARYPNAVDADWRKLSSRVNR